MAIRKGGLGKGIDALFAENSTEELNEGSSILLPINEIEPNKEQPRTIFEQESLSQLSESIAEHGILQPIIVRPRTDGSYQIVAGERRWRAAKMADIKMIPVVIKALDDSQTAALALIENLQREDLNPVEEAAGIRRLIEDFGLTQDEAAARLSKSRPALTNSLRLLNLPEQVLGLVIDRRLSPGHARALLAIEDEEALIKAAEEIAAQNLSVRDTEKLVKDFSNKEEKREKPKSGKKNPFICEVELALEGALGRKIKIHEKKTGGTIEIEYFSIEDLIDFAKSLED